MVPLIRRPAGMALRGGVWALVATALLFGATGASVLFVGVWKHEASRARVADTAAEDAARAVSSANERLRRAEGRLLSTQAQLRKARANVKRQSVLLADLGAAGRPILRDTRRLDTASQQLATDGAALGDTVAKLTNAVAALGVYLKQTSPSQLDPAYVDAQLSYLQGSLATLQTRAARLKDGSGSVAASRAALAKDAAALERLASG